MMILKNEPIIRTLERIEKNLIKDKKVILEKECKSEICRYTISLDTKNEHKNMIIEKSNKSLNSDNFDIKNKTEYSFENYIQFKKIFDDKVYNLILKGYDIENCFIY